jgi:hypothetical protein
MTYLPPVRPFGGPALTDKQLSRMAFRIELFQQHGWDEVRAERWADHLCERDTDRDDRRLCVECRNLLSQWRCAEGGPVLADVLQRCNQFVWETPKK